MGYVKGNITLYDWDYKVLVTGNYENKNEAIMLVKNWTERYLSQAHHFVIKPFVKEDEIEKYNKLVQQKRNQQAYQRRKYISEGNVIADEKIAIVRPKAEYSNHTPYGIADEVRMFKPEPKVAKKKEHRIRNHDIP